MAEPAPGDCPLHARRVHDCQDAYVRRELTTREVDHCLAASAAARTGRYRTFDTTAEET